MRYTMLAMVVAVVAGCGVEGEEAADTGLAGFDDPVYVTERVDEVTEAGAADHALACEGAGDLVISGSCDGDGVTVLSAYPEDGTWHCGIRAPGPHGAVRLRALCLGAK
jgi:hypothetical protein